MIYLLFSIILNSFGSIYLSKIEYIHPNLENNKIIERPSGTNVLLIQGLLKTMNGPEQRICYFYKVARQKTPGMFFYQLTLESECKWLPEQKVVYKEKNIRLLKGIKDIDKVSFEALRNGKKIIWKIIFPNLKKETSLVFVKDMKKKPIAAIIGSWNDRYSEGASEKCHDFDKFCDEIIPNKCSQCKFGAFPVYGGKCVTKYCGINRCGEKGEPACWKGGENLSELCDDNIRKVFCQKGLNIYCKEAKLICL